MKPTKQNKTSVQDPAPQVQPTANSVLTLQLLNQQAVIINKLDEMVTLLAKINANTKPLDSTML